MKAIWRGEDDLVGLRYGKEYEILTISRAYDCYGVIDETGVDYLYPMEDFEITEEYPPAPLRSE